VSDYTATEANVRAAYSTMRNTFLPPTEGAQEEIDRWLAGVKAEAWAEVHAHLKLAMTGSRSPNEATWPGYWEAKQRALDETTARPLSASSVPDRSKS
jgi:hypothetical protein